MATAPLSDVADRMSVRHTRGALNIIEQIGAGQFGVVAKAMLDERSTGGVPGPHGSGNNKKIGAGVISVVS